MCVGGGGQKHASQSMHSLELHGDDCCLMLQVKLLLQSSCDAQHGDFCEALKFGVIFYLSVVDHLALHLLPVHHHPEKNLHMA